MRLPLHPVSPPLRGLLAVVSGALVLGAVVLGLLLTRPATAADDPRLPRLASDLGVLEGLVAPLDGVRASWNRSLVDRVWSLHQRMHALEVPLGLPGGSVSQRGSYTYLFDDLTRLSVRLRAILLARSMASGPPQDVPPQGVFVPQPPPPPGPGSPPPGAPAGPPPAKAAPGAWPVSLTFNATARLNYEAVGTWITTRPAWISGWQSSFLQEGWRGDISFSLRAKGLVRQMKSALVRVVVRLSGPFAPGGAYYRVYDVAWEAERALSDNALKTWTNYDRLTIRGPFRWLSRPEQAGMKLDVEAHVLSLTAQDGSVVSFQAPEFVPR